TPRRARGNRQDHWLGGEHGAGDGAASRLPHSRKRAVQEFREAQLAALRSSGQKELARFRRGAREMAAAAAEPRTARGQCRRFERDRKSTRLNSSHVSISYAVFCLKKKTN